VQQLLVRQIAPTPTQELHQARVEFEEDISAAYAQLGEDRTESYLVWHGVRQKWLERVKELHKAQGYENNPSAEEYLWDRCAPVIADSDPSEHVRFLRAMLTDATRLFQETLLYRHNRGGNWIGQVIGETGLTKSSVALGLAEWFSQRSPERQMELMVYHPWTFPDVYAGGKPTEVVISDENVEVAGEGSRTLKETIRMMEQQTRKSQVNALLVSPEGSERASLFCLEVVLVNWTQKRTRCVYYYKDKALGFVDVAWCSDAMWLLYSPWKDANVERSKGAFFNDQKALFRMLNDLVDRPEFQLFVKNLNKPKKQDLEAAVRVSWGRFMPDSQLQTLVNLLYMIGYGWDRWEKDFETFCGEPAAEGLRTLSRRCYKE
jgi:hypothetical protein